MVVAALINRSVAELRPVSLSEVILDDGSFYQQLKTKTAIYRINKEQIFCQKYITFCYVSRWVSQALRRRLVTPSA